jgi:hypothetical protein
LTIGIWHSRQYTLPPNWLGRDSQNAITPSETLQPQVKQRGRSDSEWTVGRSQAEFRRPIEPRGNVKRRQPSSERLELTCSDDLEKCCGIPLVEVLVDRLDCALHLHDRLEPLDSRRIAGRPDDPGLVRD